LAGIPVGAENRLPVAGVPVIMLTWYAQASSVAIRALSVLQVWAVGETYTFADIFYFLTL
jgi:hypothetical protein